MFTFFVSVGFSSDQWRKKQSTKMGSCKDKSKQALPHIFGNILYCGIYMYTANLWHNNRWLRNPRLCICMDFSIYIFIYNLYRQYENINNRIYT